MSLFVRGTAPNGSKVVISYYRKRDEARNCRELLLEMEAGMFKMVILSEIDPVDGLRFEVDRDSLPSSDVIVIIVPEYDHRVCALSHHQSKSDPSLKMIFCDTV